jgi:hypothetical protein
VHTKGNRATGSGLTCFDCGRALEAGDGSADVDRHGFVLCRECVRAYGNYCDGQEDAAVRVLRAAVEAISPFVPHDRIHADVARALSPHNGAAESIRRMVGLDRDDENGDDDEDGAS